MNSNLKGNIALGKAISYFTEQGYIINLPLNDSQCYDLIIEKEGKLQTVQVKYTNHKGNKESYECKLSTVSGTNRKEIYNLKDTFCELLFIYCANGNMFLIPIKEIATQSIVTLNEKSSKFANKDIFDTSKYLLNKIDFDDNEYIVQYDLEGKRINKYISSMDAARALGKDNTGVASHIIAVCNGKRKTAYGYI